MCIVQELGLVYCRCAITLLPDQENNYSLQLYKNIELNCKKNYIESTNALQNGFYMCIQWTRVLYSVVIK